VYQDTKVEGNTVRITFSGRKEERHEFETPKEAEARAAIVVEALSWVGTPFKNMSDIKGPNGGIDCAMLQVRCYVDTGRIPPIDPRPYSSQFHLHKSEEEYLRIMKDIGGVEVEKPRLSDCLVYHFGRVFSHGGILINSLQIVHAFTKSGICQVSNLDEEDLMWIAQGWKRPVKYFEVRA
jgi:cell wall-associated NlpC family hydrolase